MLHYADKLPEDVNKVGRIKLYKAFAYLRKGSIEEAEKLVYEDGGLSVPDIREGENSITDLWFEIEEAKAARDGKPFEPDKLQPPAFLDFRMNTTQKKKKK